MLIQGRVKKGTVPLKSYILSRHLLSVFGEAGVKTVGTGGVIEGEKLQGNFT